MRGWRALSRSTITASVLSTHHTDITDWEQNYGPDSAYAAEVCEVAQVVYAARIWWCRWAA